MSLLQDNILDTTSFNWWEMVTKTFTVVLTQMKNG